jgi:hypothetical protein
MWRSSPLLIPMSFAVGVRNLSAAQSWYQGVPLQQQQGTQAAYRAKDPVARQAENPGTDATAMRDQSGTDAEGTDGLLKGLEGLLRLLSDSLAARKPLDGYAIVCNR